ncbi:MAG TPA: thioesterase family protein [Gemmatimonadales bacterium]|nr:thioesterase family protein [Gemmatimonadales bacterium]
MTGISTIELTVRYAESDQMGVAYHANHLVWCDMARTEYLRERGIRYRDLEAGGLRLAVVEAQVRYRGPARFDDRLRVRCWVREVASRRVEFGYAMDDAVSGRVVATARTALVPLDARYALTTLPTHVRTVLAPVPDPVRL